MNERDRLYLGHILAAIDDIVALIADGREAFVSDRKTQSAVIRQPGTIGEAVERPSVELTTAHPAVPWWQIAGTRHRLIHGDFTVDLDAVWAMVDRDLPVLQSRIRQIVDSSVSS